MSEVIALVCRILRAGVHGLIAMVAVFVIIRIVISYTIGTGDNTPLTPPHVLALQARYWWVHEVNLYAALVAGLVAVAITMRRRQPPVSGKAGENSQGREAGRISGKISA